jgi:hypothetical protein
MHIYLHKLGTCCIIGPNGPWPSLIADVAAYAGTRFVHVLRARPTACSSLPSRQSHLGLSLPRRVVCACLGQPRPSPSLCQEAVGQVPPRLPEPSAISSVVSARRPPLVPLHHALQLPRHAPGPQLLGPDQTGGPTGKRLNQRL